MHRARAALLALPLALAGVGVSFRATWKLAEERRQLAELGAAGRAAGESFVETLKGEQAERQWIAYDERRALALSMATARRDRLLGVLATAAALMFAAFAFILGKISEEVEEDRRHVAQTSAQGGKPEP